jgi:Asp-tRNA(Asn)/Glu-tRNA(Gln) amidotransferase A subunit family amidase
LAIDHYSSACDMLPALARREISAAELAELHIAWIEAHDAALNAIPVRTFERAREQARVSDGRLAAGERGPLLGLPMTLKDGPYLEDRATLRFAQLVAQEWLCLEAPPGYP